jgi:carboxypeptidase Taq
MTQSAYQALEQTYTKLHRFEHLRSIAWWDQASNMPPKGNSARGAALAEVATLLHRMRTDPGLGARIVEAEAEFLDDVERANLREIRRDWLLATALPEVLVERRELAQSRCEHAWRTQRPANDWAGFLENFRPVLAIAREQAERLSQVTGNTPYDALMNQYEPGMTSTELERIFGDLRTWLPGLIREARERQAQDQPVEPQGPFPIPAQRALCERVMRALGFDFDAGRLDVSTHPFCGGVPEDVRITTRFSDDDFLKSLMGTIHETGHASYEQNLPRERLGQPVALARSMAIHESQSLSFEMQLARSPAFVEWLAPQVAEAFGRQPAFTSENLLKLMTRVEPGFIRVDADEATYPAHIILRWEIERGLIERELEAEDIPAAWDQRMQELLGIDTRGNYRNGPLQDVHWPEGLFGYFPCYSLGAMYAAQWFAEIRTAVPDLDARVRTGDFAPAFDWLRANVWSQASRYPTGELVARATRRPLDPGAFRAHLESRYLGRVRASGVR